MPKVSEKRPKSFTDYVKVVEKLQSGRSDQLWFRGAGNDSHRLVPSLYRHKTRTTAAEIAKLELETMARFRQRSIPFTERSLVDDWDALFFMQHYRVPTRLLDWSENPFVAFYFAAMSAACERAPSGDLIFGGDAAVWVLDPVAWNRKALAHMGYDGGVLSTTDEGLNGYRPSGKFAGMNNHPVALFGAHNSPRIVAQRGVFTIFGQELHSMEEVYCEAKFPKDCLVKIRLNQTLLPAMRATILNYGITESVVFPDLDGLANEMRRTFGFTQ